MIRLLRYSTLILVERLSNIALSLVRLKVVAVILGPAGMGVLSQVTTLTDTLERFAIQGAQLGVRKVAAENADPLDRPALRRLVLTSSILVGAFAFLVVSGISVFAEQVSSWILGSRKYAVYVVIASGAAVLFGLGRIWVAALQGTFQHQLVLKVSTAASAVGVIASVLLVLGFGLDGAVTGVLVSGSAMALAFAWTVRHQFWQESHGDGRAGDRRNDATGGRFSFGLVREIIPFGGYSVLDGLTSLGVLLFIRSQLISELGEAANGIFHVAYLAGAQLIGVFLASVWSYAMPNAVTLRDDREALGHAKTELLHLIVLVLVPGCLLLWTTGQWWIPLLFSGSFLPALSLLPWQLSADVLRSFRSTNNTTFVARKRFSYLTMETVTFSGLVVVSFVLMFPKLQLLAAPTAYLAANVLMLTPSFLFAYTDEGFAPDAATVKMVLGELAVILVLGFMATHSQMAHGPAANTAATLILLAGWAFITPAGSLYQQYGRELMTNWRRQA